MASKPTPPSSAASASNAWVIAIVVMAVLGTGVFLIARYASASSNKAPVALTPEAKAYVRNLKISEPEMKAHESYMKQSIVEITGKIKNDGPQALNTVDIFCSFYDAYSQLVVKERVSIVRQKMGGLKPGEEKPFRLAFDTVPEAWNQQMPNLVIAGIQFAE